MTTLSQARQAAYSRFVDEWKNGGNPLTPFCFDNEGFDPPIDAAGRGLPWARCSVRSIGRRQQTLGAPGNRKYTSRALVRVEVYVAPSVGLKDPDVLAEKAQEMYEGRYLAGALTYGAVIREVGLVDDDHWFLSTMEATFDYEQVK
jgi:hypothetical protein